MQAFKISIHRKYFIDKKIRDKSFPTATSLAKDYAKEGNESFDPRTFATDVSELRHIHKAPLRYDYKNRGYYYTDENYRFNILEEEENSVVFENMQDNSSAEVTIPEWQKNLILSFMNEVLPKQRNGKKGEADFSNAPITVLPSSIENTDDTNVEKVFLKALENQLVLSIEIVTSQNNLERSDFLPLHLVCQGQDRLYFGKEFREKNMGGGKFCLLNISTVSSAAVSYEPQKSRDTHKEAAEKDANFSSLRDRELKKISKGSISYYAQTTGNHDIEIVMQDSSQKHILVFTCYPSVQRGDINQKYEIAGDFILYTIS